MRSAHYYCLLVVFVFFSNSFYAQNNLVSKKASFPSLFENPIDKQNLLKTNNQLFLVKIYTIDKVIARKNQHWFLKLNDPSNLPLDFANMQLSGYLKSDEGITYNYKNAIVPLGNDGKYIIKAVEIPQNGIWIFKVTINDSTQTDTFVFETTVY